MSDGLATQSGHTWDTGVKWASWTLHLLLATTSLPVPRHPQYWFCPSALPQQIHKLFCLVMSQKLLEAGMPLVVALLPR